MPKKTMKEKAGMVLMRKRIALFLSLIMVTLAFTGCTTEEIGYWNMSKDAIKGMSKVVASGEVQMLIDLDEIENFAMKIEKNMGASEEELATFESANVLDGTIGATLKYTLHADMNKMAYMMDAKLIYEGNTYDFGEIYMSMTDGYYISTQALVAALDFEADVLTGEGFARDEAYDTALKAAILQEKFIEIPMSDSSEMEAEVAAMMESMEFEDIYDAALKLYEDIFGGFTTGMVSAIPGGYKVEATGKEAANLLLNTMTYLSENADTVLKAVNDYMLVVIDSMEIPDEEKGAVKAELSELVSDKAGFLSAMEDIRVGLAGALQNETVGLVLDSISYKQTYVKEGKTMVSAEEFTMMNEGKTMISLVSSGKTEKTTRVLNAPTGAVSFDTVRANATVVEDQYNPVVAADVFWTTDSNDASISYSRETYSIFSTYTFDEATYQNVDGRVYLPLRTICEGLNEEVSWDQAAKTASVVRGDSSVAMEGLIKDGKTYVKVRDFEKLGYDVEYDSQSVYYKSIYITKIAE